MGEWDQHRSGRPVGCASNTRVIERLLPKGYTFEPMGIKDVTTSPNAQMKKDLAFLNSRDPELNLRLNVDGQLNRRPLIVTKPEDIKSTFNAGGAGCFARPAEYCQIINMLLKSRHARKDWSSNFEAQNGQGDVHKPDNGNARVWETTYRSTEEAASESYLRSIPAASRDGA